MISAEKTIRKTAKRAVETGRPDDGRGVGGMSVLVDANVFVGHGVIVGGFVGVEVGLVGVDVKDGRINSF
jgi:hypothetical protein